MQTLNMTVHVSGEYRIIVRRSDGTVRLETDWIPNLITNYGLNRMGGFNDWMNGCHVGTGTTPPAPTDTALASFLAGTTTDTSSNGVSTTPPYHAWRIKTYSFTQGQVVGDITEVGIGISAASGNLFSRILLASPITVLADEVLQIAYKFSCYAPTGDVTGTVDISGTQYNWTSRAAGATNSTRWQIGIDGTAANRTSTATGNQHAWSGAIGDVTSVPSGTSSAVSSVSVAGYVTDSFSRSFTMTWELAAGNFAGGVRSVSITMGIGTYQVEFDPPIPKTSDDILSLTFSHAWARRP